MSAHELLYRSDKTLINHVQNKDYFASSLCLKFHTFIFKTCFFPDLFPRSSGFTDQLRAALRQKVMDECNTGRKSKSRYGLPFSPGEMKSPLSRSQQNGTQKSNETLGVFLRRIKTILSVKNIFLQISFC